LSALDEAPILPIRSIIQWLNRIGLFLAAAGVCWLIGNRLWYSTRTWTALDVPVSLAIGHVTTPEFQVNLEDQFEVELDVDRPVPSDVMDDVLGIGESPSAANANLRGFKLAWALRCNEEVVKQGVSDGRGEGYWGKTTGRVLSYFPARGGKVYRLDIDVLDDGSRLSPYHPHLKVAVDLFALDGYAITEGLKEIAGCLAAALGIVLLAAAAITKTVDRRRLAQSQKQANLRSSP
jgi:hypothetical protein